jgi:two-component system sensor histidine kinase UhpB
LKESGNLDDGGYNYKRLSEFYVSTKQYEKAFENITKYYAVKDSITGLNVQVQMKQMEEGYSSAKKESEIQLLKKDKELQQQKLARQKVLMIGAAALALLALGGIWLLINRNKLKQRMKELELRNQIAADLHDEVGSSLSSIHLLSQMAAQPGNDVLQKNVLEKMSVNAKETMDKMSDLVWTIKPEEAEGSNLKQRMERFAYEICGTKNIEVDLQLSKLDTKDLNMEQRKNMYLIFKEALNNAVKYSGTEKVHVSATNGQNILTMIVRDEGKGFDIKSITKGNGLDNIHSRAVSVGGNLNITSETGNGTEVKLILPLKT